MVKQNSNTELKVNNRWIMDTNEKKYSDRKKEKKEPKSHYRNKYENRSFEKVKPKEEELNIHNEIMFPCLVSSNTKETDEPKNKSYLEKLNIKEEEKSSAIKLKRGWVCLKKDKNTNNVLVSRDGRNFYNNINESYSEEELEKQRMNEFNRNIRIFENRLEEMYIRDKRISDEYYELTGKLDIFAQVEKEREEYEEYLRKFDEELEEIEEENYSSDSENSVNSDNNYKYR